jgi:hypothetical protein
MDLRGFDSFGYLSYLLLNELDRLEGNPTCCMIGKVSPTLLPGIFSISIIENSGEILCKQNDGAFSFPRKKLQRSSWRKRLDSFV